ncbi:MAG: hypothetical protein JWN48_1085 [Myxococcaceae bacterium]|nr:hypothetical protein [Myxococcaceae bacterium]
MPVMRVDVEPLDLFVQLMTDNRPCPGCGSSRVTVRRAGMGPGSLVRSECADCGRTRELTEPAPQ